MRFAALVLAAATLGAAPPVLQELGPRGAQRGKSFTLYLRGEGLTPDARVESALPGSFSRLTLSRDPLAGSAGARPNSVLPFLVTIKADAPVGLYPVRVRTAEGISNLMLFSVGDWPEMEEPESRDPRASNDAGADAVKITAPIVVNGKLTAADIDNYRFTARAGQKLVFEVEARRAGSAIDPAIEIFDAAGKELARNDDAPGLGVDARVEVAFSKAGEYRVQVHDSKYSDQAQNFYRLHVGEYEFADGFFPLGWRRGEDVEISLLGGNLSKPVRVRPESTPGDLVPVRVPGSPGLPLLFVRSDQPEMLEPAGGPAELVEGTIMNGRLSKPGEVDRYGVRVRPGEKWVFELAAASLGVSPLDAVLALYDPGGKKLARADDGNGVDPVLPFTVPAGVSEVVLAVEDLLGRGGDLFGYRLQGRRQPPDFVADLLTPFVNVPAGGTAQVAVLIQRRGYDGEIRVGIPKLPAGLEVAGGHVPAEAAAQNFNNDNAGRRSARTVLTITAAPDARAVSAELDVVAEAHTPDGVLRRHARGPALVTAVRGDRQRAVTASWLGMRLPLAVSAAPAAVLAVGTPMARFSQGFEYELRYEVQRSSALRAPVKVNLQIAGAVGNLRILKGLDQKGGDRGSFLINTNFATPATTFDVVLEGRTEMDGRPLVLTSPAVSVQVVPGYQISLEKTALEVSPGSALRVAGRVRREPTFEGGLVRVRVEDLPDHVQCPAVDVAPGQKEFVLACQASPEARPGSFPIRIASVAPETGRKAKADYKVPDLEASLVVSGAARAAR